MKHSQLIKIAQSFGYTFITSEGLCKGFSGMWIQAVCAGDVNSFYARLKLLEKYSIKKLHQKIEDAREAVKQKKILTPEQEAEQKALLEIPVFFQGIALYLQPLMGHEIFEKVLGQTNEEEISHFLQSKELEKRGGLKNAFYTTDYYFPNEIIAHLDKISKELIDKPNVAIDFGANDHSVTVRVVKDKRGQALFELVDTNHLNKIGKLYTSKQLARELQVSFWYSPLKPLMMSTSIFTSQNNPLNLVELKNTNPIHRLISIESKSKGTETNLLNEAAGHNDVDTLTRMVFSPDDGVDVNQLCNNTSALAMAAGCNSTDAAEYLLDISGIDINASSPLPPLFFAISHKNYGLARKIIQHKGFDLDKHKTALLQLAATQYPNSETVEFAKKLMDLGGCDLHLMSEFPNSPASYKNSYIFIKTNNTQELYYIKSNGESEKVKIDNFNLFEEKISAINKNNDDIKLHLSEEQIKEIVTSNGGHTHLGLDVNTQDDLGRTALHYACKAGNKDLVQLFLDNGAAASINKQDKNGITPLKEACSTGNIELVQLLLDKGAEVGWTNSKKANLLHAAAITGKASLIQLLLDKGLDPTQATIANDSPLHFACMKGNREAVELLISKNTSMCNLYNEDGLRPLDYACKYNDPNLLPSLLKHTTLTRKDLEKNSPLSKLIQTCSREMQNDFLKTALASYITDRGNAHAPSHLNFLNLGIAKSNKINAATAFLKVVEGQSNAEALKSFQAELNDGLLSSFYELYKKIKKDEFSSFEQFLKAKNWSMAEKLLPHINVLDSNLFSKDGLFKIIDNPMLKKKILEQGLCNYIQRREVESEYKDWLNLGFSKKEKIEAAQAFLAYIHDPAKEISPEHMQILKDGRLGNLYFQYQQLSGELTQNYKNQLEALRQENSQRQEDPEQALPPGLLH